MFSISAISPNRKPANQWALANSSASETGNLAKFILSEIIRGKLHPSVATNYPYGNAFNLNIFKTRINDNRF